MDNDAGTSADASADGSGRIHGHCLCGAVRFSSGAAAREIGVCHCGLCRRWGGGPLLALHCGPDLRFDGGAEQLSVYASSDWAQRGFCRHCGSHLFYKLLATGEYFVPAGVFDESAGRNFVLSSQIYVDKKPAYYDFAQATPMLSEAQVIAQYGGGG